MHNEVFDIKKEVIREVYGRESRKGMKFTQ